jgi:hypothetical protein
MSNALEKPLILGNFYYGNGEMAWAWWHEEHADIAIIGDSEISPRKDLVKGITKLFTSVDPKCVYSITTDIGQPGELDIIDAINWVEEFPEPPEQYQDRDTFIKNRHFFSTSYFNLLAKINEVPRSQFLPSISFKPHLEGPLKGYKRVIVGLSDDVSYKTTLQEHVDLLEKIPWVNVNGEGRKYFLKEDGSQYEKALYFLTAVWSFWAMTCQTEVHQQMLLIVEPPKELLKHDVDPLVEQVMYQALAILKYVSSVTTTTLVVSTDMLYPVPELHLRYKVIFETKDADLDFTNPKLRNAFDPALFTEWDAGNKMVGLWMDEIASNDSDARILVKFSPDHLTLWEDKDAESDE